MSLVPKVHLRRDYRFTLEEQYLKYVEPLLQEQPWVQAITVIHPTHLDVEGWFLHDYQYAPPVIIWETP